MKNIIKTIISDFHKNGLKQYLSRDIKIPLNSGKIITLIGPRRSGKTFYLYQIIDELIKTNKLVIEDFIYINFEDERLNFSTSNLNSIIDAYLELYPNKKLEEIYFFFDEIQEIENWEKFVRRVYDTFSKNIFITGSSAKLLSKEIATSLRGRTLSYEIYPLSFKEFLSFKNIDVKDLYSTKNKAIIIPEFEKYFLFGGFPEIINFDYDLKIKTHQNYLDVMIFRDLVQRYDISNVEVLKLFIKKGISNISKEFSINKIYNDFKSLNLKISKDKLYEFSNHVEDIYLLFYLNQYTNSIHKTELSVKKIYCIDIGFVDSNAFKFSEDRGRLLENLVFLQFKRQNLDIYFHKEKYECDFVISDRGKIIQAVQVTKSLSDEETRKRELNGLIEACKKYKLTSGLILTQDEEQEIKEKGIIIKIIPIWKFLLISNPQ